MKKIIPFTFILIFICLMSSCKKTNRYQISGNPSSGTVVLDTKTGKVYSFFEETIVTTDPFSKKRTLESMEIIDKRKKGDRQ